MQWKRRRFYFQENGGDSDKAFNESINHAHRSLLVESISSHAPLDSALEIGCNTGSKLYLLSLQYPNAKLYGIDINSEVIEDGKDQLSMRGINNVFLSFGKADSLKSFSNKSVDIVFTDAVIMYIGPDKIGGILKEAVRIARKAVILNEWHMESESLKFKKEYKYHYGHWIWDFHKLCAPYVPPERVRITRIPKELWNDANWNEFGAIIEMNLCRTYNATSESHTPLTS